jgi:septal ring factor EnvC (AmiA/AmiB activator)
MKKTLTVQERLDEARRQIAAMQEQLHNQREYIRELEKQLEHVEPGVLKKAQEFLKDHHES